jgi:hypothetical protein
VARAWFLLLSAVGLFGSLALLPPNLSAQGCSPKQGEPVIYGSSQCSGASFGSTAYIDASIFYHSGNYGDLCGTLNSILLGKTTPAYPTAGAVIDARGILQPPTQIPPTYITCTSNPFSGVTVPSTILLPGTNIQISQAWTLPSNTHIIG